ncbi:hypothetical protein Acr_21g0006360 [Actinidia rufa]|uniref:Late embryogenesis abundant (LEA) hydroxyproline-rich glycoprotein family n=1 Tax=Actinidia rufa TaxID=165716 RepID=A0A7J0GGU2_9ERIC|nr:hypothetical protein Acr_21g0006360 [Actinidia rufa]
MAERVPLPITAKHGPNPTEPSEPASGSGTYVVQVPKDQIYRFPPPEHAVLAKRYRHLPRQKRPCCSCCLCIFISVIVIALVLGLIGGIGVSSVFLKHKSPKFQIENVLVNNPLPNHNQKHPEYDIVLTSENPYQLVRILYDEGGDASLSFAQQEIATGKYPTFEQGPQNSTVFKMILRGSKLALPKEMEKSMESANQKVHISLSISMGVPIRLRMGALKTGSKKVYVSCNLTVDTLAKHNRILSQECHTKS